MGVRCFVARVACGRGSDVQSNDIEHVVAKAIFGL